MARYTGPIQKKLRSLGLDKYGVYGEKKKVNPAGGRRRRDRPNSPPRSAG